MGKCFVKELGNNRFEVDRPDGSWLILEWDELKAIESYMRTRKWVAQIEEQIGRDEDSLDFGVEISRQQFVSLCLDEIGDKIMYYGEDYKPIYEDIVFEVAQDNDIWRDD